ncbi:MAG TPA: hypothetical protein P5294_01455 [Smithellaceae bacterium]|nr:hypothetical protein [Smithellaceae bacterium]HRS89307.1 hypothetical protein [Smithellaceae bacterium]HRV25177.1 hypothetical protein [Smithellaceae bacterium]
MNKKVIFAVLALVFLVAPTAAAKTIIKLGSPVTVVENETVDNVITFGSQITVSGLVERNVIALGGSVVLTGKAVVRGNVFSLGGVIAQGSSAQVFGKTTEINSANIKNSFSSFFRGEPEGWPDLVNIFSFLFQAIIFILALFLVFIFPGSINALKKIVQNNKVKSFFVGFFITLMITPFFLFLILSIIGIYLIPAFFIALVAAFMFGYIAAAAILGDFTLSAIFSSREKSLFKETFGGLILLLILGWLPYLGWLIKIVMLTMGFGGVMLLASGVRK